MKGDHVLAGVQGDVRLALGCKTRLRVVKTQAHDTLVVTICLQDELPALHLFEVVAMITLVRAVMK